ncbi:single-stranded DNA-binding protein [Bacillus swezeyi]|uniref:Single-stranded DNA-binding protein n=1 Tax=Bacillus swezeyi TaxID=1925020 RepID=A0A5M8RVQ2_9BACI|nr:single-stranded DNA-binding protein [Bacillus swezeyi]KAA6450904.1 single-stranded DNA-binding protein [Bacillus swezeyi]KAA6474898.1 single-stranded DNA-binding protein [Bacillus swezeyi]TYS37437.1 single-stranded DNA-binding protein [Bacillus swezeyi]
MFNQIMLVGRLTKDPELRHTSNGVPVANIILAVSRHFKNAGGEIETDFVNCTLWRKTAENTAEYCRKGTIIGLNGRIQTRNDVDSEGKRVFKTEVVARSVRFLGEKPRESADA